MVGYSPEVRRKLHELLNNNSAPSSRAEKYIASQTIANLFCPEINPDWITGLQPIAEPGRKKAHGFHPSFALTFFQGIPVPFANIMLIDEDHMQYYNGTAQVHGLTPAEVRELSLVQLNGLWARSSIVADLLAQMANLRGIWGNQEEMDYFTNLFPPRIREMFYQGYWQVEQYRAKYFDWLNRHPLVYYVDNWGVRPMR